MKPIHISKLPHYTVQAQHFSQAPLAAELDQLDEIGAALSAERFDRFVDLIIDHQVVPLSPLDQVVVIDDALTVVRVEVVDGGSRGFQGWVPATWLHPVEPGAPGHGAAA
jgi:hypothetical protein